MRIIYNLSKIIKLVPLVLIVGGTSKQHKRMPWKVFHQNTKALGGF